MSRDQLVSAREVLHAIAEVRRVGTDRVLREWEQREPDLTEHLLEGLSELHRRVAAIAPHPKAERRLIRHAETLVLVLLTALRRAMLRHWQADEATPGEDRTSPGPTNPEPLERDRQEPEGRGGDAGE